MTTLSLVPPSTGRPGRRRWHRALPLVVRAGLVASLLAAWATLRTSAVIAARVVLWCSADVRRLRTILTGLATCAAVGALAGAGVGLLLARVVRVALGVLS